MADFFDPNVALAEGAKFTDNLRDQSRKTAAYNALLAAYGPAVAGDPDTALKGQEFQQRTQTNPIAVQQASANLDTTTQENAYNALANPKKLTGLDLTNANTEAGTANTQASTARTNALLPGEVTQQGATLAQTRANTGLTQAQTQAENMDISKSRLALNTAAAANDRQAVMGILAGISDTAAAGGDVGAAFDKVAPMVAKLEGHDGADLTPLRAALVQDPVGTINRLTDAIHAANAQALGQSSKGGSLALQQVKIAGQNMALRDGLNFTQQRTAAVPALTDQISALIPKMATLATMRKAKAEVPGTPEYQYNALVEQLKPNLSLDDIRNLKSSGTSLARVTNQEMSMAANAIGNMDLGQDLSTLRANALRIKNTYNVVNSDVAAAIKRVGSGGGVGAGHVADPKQTFVKGQIYTDSAGNKATWTGTGWQEMQ